MKNHQNQRRMLLNSMENNSIAIIASANMSLRNRDVYYPFRQNSDFLYLTGFNEQDAVAVLIPGRSQGEYILFCREKDAAIEQWDGYIAGQEGAVRDYLADDSFPIDDIDDILPGLLENKDRVYYTMGRSSSFDQRMIKWLNRVRSNVRLGISAPSEFVDLDFLLHEFRLLKSTAEMQKMETAAKVTAHAHQRAMQICRPGKMEYELAAIIEYEFMRNNMCTAYPTIVGAGKNGCILHYIANQQPLEDGDLVLIDAGAEYNGYAADVSRTFPVNGSFSRPQQDLYQIVLEAQQAAIKATIAGNHWDDPHQAALRVLTKGLLALGILSGNLNTLIKQEAYKPYYMHRTGHWLGMDVHDVGDYKVDGNWRLLEQGMVTTVEPGLYMPNDSNVPSYYRNIGIRIEDDIAITKKGNKVLTAMVPKDIAAIEQLVGSDSK